MTKCEALNELKKNAGSQFDPHIVDVFVDVIDALGDVAASS
jgi:response regulator RpfG family c-di-GMP phosphodiesterase